jgi:hypothetical protein
VTSKSTALTVKLVGVTDSVTIAGDWLDKADALTTTAKEIAVIDNPTAFQNASEILRDITKHSNALETLRKDIAKPFRDADAAIKKAADKARLPIETEKARLGQLIGNYAVAEQRKLDEQRRKQEMAAQAEICKQAAAHQEAVEAGLVEEDAAFVPVVAPVVVIPDAPKASGVRIGQKVAYTIVAEDSVPEMFKTVDPVKVNAWLKMNQDRVEKALEADPTSGDKVVPGIVFRFETKVASR